MSEGTEKSSTPDTIEKEITTITKNGYRTLVDATKKSNELPKGRDYDFYKTHESFQETMHSESMRLLNMMQKILNHNEIEGNMKTALLTKKTDLLSETNDVILDRVATTIDELNGLRNFPQQPVIQTVSATIPINGSWNRVNNMVINRNVERNPFIYGQSGTKSMKLLTANNIIRPQKFFKDKIDNSNNNPWMPRISEKPNSLKPLAIYMEPSEEEGGFDEFCHPYEYELDRFNVSREFLQVNQTPDKPKSIEDTPLIEVSNESALESLLENLRRSKVFAVDLEHHSYRTFQGITCLLQISTNEADYLVDTLALRDKLHILNEVFTKTSILKVFHGADCDIQWLQRDLSIYVVNMFDTHRAAKVLGYSGLSLAYLLQRFCFFLPNKKFQLADWRIRPLPQELKDYAREDTHYLIYIYEMLKVELEKKGNEEQNLLESVFQQSTEVCKTKYIKPRLTENSHLALYRRRKVAFDNRQMYALREIYTWRDTIARTEDESTGYVLPNHMMLQIAETLPREIQGIFACCNPTPPLVRSYSVELHKMILKAREQPLQKVLLPEENRQIASKESVKINIDSPLYCPHDLTKQQEFRDDLPTLLGGSTKSNQRVFIEKTLPLEKPIVSCSVFNDTINAKIAKSAKEKVSNLVFLGPYERYKLVRPFLNAEEIKQSTEDPSVGDRIASLHEHFVREVQKHSETSAESVANDVNKAAIKPEQPKSGQFHHLKEPLVQMAGGKKRKRDQFFIRKRLMKNDPGIESSVPQTKFTPGEDVDRNTKRNRRSRNRFLHWKQNQNNRNRNDAKEEKKVDKQETVVKQEKAGGSFQPFDYSTVNATQFSGGGRKVQQNEVRSKFKGRGNKSRATSKGRGAYQNNKSVTFRHNPWTKSKGT